MKYIVSIESVFTNEGEQKHEIVLVHSGRFVKSSLCEDHAIIGSEEDARASRAICKDLGDFSGAGDLLYPDGLLELLKRNAKTES